MAAEVDPQAGKPLHSALFTLRLWSTEHRTAAAGHRMLGLLPASGQSLVYASNLDRLIQDETDLVHILTLSLTSYVG